MFARSCLLGAIVVLFVLIGILLSREIEGGMAVNAASVGDQRILIPLLALKQPTSTPSNNSGIYSIQNGCETKQNNIFLHNNRVNNDPVLVCENTRSCPDNNSNNKIDLKVNPMTDSIVHLGQSPVPISPVHHPPNHHAIHHPNPHVVPHGNIQQLQGFNGTMQDPMTGNGAISKVHNGPALLVRLKSVDDLLEFRKASNGSNRGSENAPYSGIHAIIPLSPDMEAFMRWLQEAPPPCPFHFGLCNVAVQNGHSKHGHLKSSSTSPSSPFFYYQSRLDMFLQERLPWIHLTYNKDKNVPNNCPTNNMLNASGDNSEDAMFVELLHRALFLGHHSQPLLDIHTARMKEVAAKVAKSRVPVVLEQEALVPHLLTMIRERRRRWPLWIPPELRPDPQLHPNLSVVVYSGPYLVWNTREALHLVIPSLKDTAAFLCPLLIGLMLWVWMLVVAVHVMDALWSYDRLHPNSLPSWSSAPSKRGSKSRHNLNGPPPAPFGCTSMHVTVAPPAHIVFEGSNNNRAIGRKGKDVSSIPQLPLSYDILPPRFSPVEDPSATGHQDNIKGGQPTATTTTVSQKEKEKKHVSQRFWGSWFWAFVEHLPFLPFLFSVAGCEFVLTMAGWVLMARGYLTPPVVRLRIDITNSYKKSVVSGNATRESIDVDDGDDKTAKVWWWCELDLCQIPGHIPARPAVEPFLDRYRAARSSWWSVFFPSSSAVYDYGAAASGLFGRKKKVRQSVRYNASGTRASSQRTKSISSSSSGDEAQGDVVPFFKRKIMQKKPSQQTITTQRRPASNQESRNDGEEDYGVGEGEQRHASHFPNITFKKRPQQHPTKQLPSLSRKASFDKNSLANTNANTIIRSNLAAGKNVTIHKPAATVASESKPLSVAKQVKTFKEAVLANNDYWDETEGFSSNEEQSQDNDDFPLLSSSTPSPQRTLSSLTMEVKQQPLAPPPGLSVHDKSSLLEDSLLLSGLKREPCGLNTECNYPPSNGLNSRKLSFTGIEFPTQPSNHLGQQEKPLKPSNYTQADALLESMLVQECRDLPPQNLSLGDFLKWDESQPFASGSDSQSSIDDKNDVEEDEDYGGFVPRFLRYLRQPSSSANFSATRSSNNSSARSSPLQTPFTRQSSSNFGGFF